MFSTIYLTPASISFLTQFIVSLTICVFLVRRLWQFRGNQHLRLLTGFFIPVTVYLGLLFFDAVLSPHLRLLAVYALNTVLALALVFLILFAYNFPRKYPQHKFETRLALLLSLAYLLWEGGFMVYRYIALVGAETVYYRPPFSAYVNAVILLWAPVAFARQSIAADAREVSWLRKFWRPEGKDARGARAFVLVFLILFVLGIINILRLFALSTTFYNAAMSVGILISLWLFSTNYVRFIPGGARVQTKLMVLSLTILLALLGSVGWFIAPPYIATFEPNLKDHQTLRFTPDGAGGYKVAEVDFNFENDLGERIHVEPSHHPQNKNRNHKIAFDFPFLGQTYREIYIVNSGAISLGEPFWQPNMQSCCATSPTIFPLMVDLDSNPLPGSGAGLYVRTDMETGRLIITWDHLPAIFKPSEIFSFQAILYSDGVIEFTYNGLPSSMIFDPDATPSANPWMMGIVSGQGEPLHNNDAKLLAGGPLLFENYQFAFRLYLHEFVRNLAFLVIFGSIAMVIGIPLLLKVSIIKPLDSLLSGVQEIESGNLAVKVPIQSEDEIGYLTGAFNNMAARLDELVESLEERFKQFFEYEPDYCYMISPDGLILDVNPAALESLGYEYHELVGQHHKEIYTPESQAKLKQLYLRVDDQGGLENEELIIQTKAGRNRTVLLSAGAVRDRNGNLLHSLSIQHDITERKLSEQTLQASEERYRTLVENADDSIFLLDLELCLVSANQVLFKAMQTTETELIGKTILDFMPLHIAENARNKVQEVIATRKPVSYEVETVTPTGTVWINVRLSPVFDEEGNLFQILGISHDITKRVQAEKAIVELATIEERRRLARDLHDSMTQSLHSLVLSAETTQHLFHDNQPEKLDASLEMLGESARQSLREMRLLCFELQLMPEEQVDWYEILQARLENVEGRTGITTQFEIENQGMIPDEFEREFFYIITEALNNILKHSRADFVSIIIHASPTQVMLQITDNGLGFSPEKIGNNGMGLVNIKERVARLGGELRIDSAPRGGTAIFINIALEKMEAPQIQAKA